MKYPLILYILSILIAGAALIPGSPFGPETLYWGLLAATAAFVLLVRGAFREDTGNTLPVVIVDGSNVMYWHNNTPDLASVKHVVQELRNKGMLPIIGFDANAGYLTQKRYLGPAHLARQLGVSKAQVFVAPRGTPADPLILKRAKSMKARVVTNDRFRDWEDTYPFLRARGFLVEGQIANGAVRLTLV